MTFMQEADNQIAQLERALAAEQTSSAFSQLEAAFVRERLRATLSMAVKVAERLPALLAIPIDEHLDDIRRDFAPR